MTAGTIEKIQVILQAVTAGFAKGLGRAQTQLKSVGKNMQNFGQVMQAPMENFKMMNKVVGMSVQRFNKFAKGLAPEALQEFGLRMRKSGAFVDIHTKRVMSATNAQKQMTQQVSNLGGKVGNTFRRLTHGMRGFRMEALGVMFFGMMMQRMFMGLLQPVMEAFGVFDLFRLMLLTLFLPVMEMIFPILLDIVERFINLSDSTKKMIGIFVILGAIFGVVLMVFGQFALGIGSLILFFGALASPILLVAIALAAIVGYVFLKDFFKNLGKEVDKTKEKLVSFGLSGEVFDKMKDKIIEWFDVLKEKFSGLKTKIGKWIGENLPILLAGGGDMLMSLVDGIVENSEKIGTAIRKVIDKIITWIDNNYKDIMNSGLEILQAIIDGLIENKDKIGNALEKMLEAMGTWLGTNAWKLIKFGASIAWYIVKGLTKGILGGLDSALSSVIPGYSSAKSAVNKVVFSRRDDFIWRPGQGAVSINPNDTLVGFKGTPPGLGGGSSSILQENHFYGFTMDDLKRDLDDRDRRLVDEIRRLVKT